MVIAHRVIKGIDVWVVVGLLLAAPLARAEQVEIVTYYPSPSAMTDDIRAKRVTVGENYKALNLDDSLAKIEQGTLLVERSIGIGLPTIAPVPFSTAPGKSGQSPKNNLLGNLDVNDIWLRSTQSWASQAFADSVAPTSPFKFYIGQAIWVINPQDNNNQWWRVASSASVDVYAALGLWRYGKKRSDISMTDWNGMGLGFGKSVEAWGSGGVHWTVTYSSPTFVSGYVKVPEAAWRVRDQTNHTEAPYDGYEIILTW